MRLYLGIWNIAENSLLCCRCVSVGEHYFSSHAGVRLLQVGWHPGSSTDSHLLLLTSDNLVRYPSCVPHYVGCSIYPRQVP